MTQQDQDIYRGFLLEETGTEPGFPWVAWRTEAQKRMNITSYTAPDKNTLRVYIDDSNDDGEYGKPVKHFEVHKEGTVGIGSLLIVSGSSQVVLAASTHYSEFESFSREELCKILSEYITQKWGRDYHATFVSVVPADGYPYVI